MKAYAEKSELPLAKGKYSRPQDDIVFLAGASPLHPALQVQTQLFDFFVHFDISFFRIGVCQQPECICAFCILHFAFCILHSSLVPPS